MSTRAVVTGANGFVTLRLCEQALSRSWQICGAIRLLCLNCRSPCDYVSRRSLVALDNLVDFIVTSMSHTQAANHTFLVSQGYDISTTELVRGLMRAPNVSARLMPLPVRALRAGAILRAIEGEVQRHCGNLQVDISKARNVLGCHPPVPVDEALRRAVVGLQTS